MGSKLHEKVNHMLHGFAERLREMQEIKRDERGFTLIELLVVMINSPPGVLEPEGERSGGDGRVRSEERGDDSTSILHLIRRLGCERHGNGRCCGRSYRQYRHVGRLRLLYL